MSKINKPVAISTFDTRYDDSIVTKEDIRGEISLLQIVKQETQPRKHFNPQALEQLTLSVKAHGVLEPILVRSLGNDKYGLIAGERRLRAAELAGLISIPAVILVVDEDTARIIALTENLQRSDLNPVEKMEGCLQILAIELNKPVEEIPSLLYDLQRKYKQFKKAACNVTSNLNSLDDDNAAVENNSQAFKEFLNQTPEYKNIGVIFERIGLTLDSFICNLLPLRKMDENILQVLREEKIEYTKAKIINKIKDQPQRLNILHEAIEKKWSLAEIKNQVNALLNIESTSTQLPNQQRIQQLWEKTIPQIKKARVWDNTNKQERLENLLMQLQSLLNEQI